MKSGYRLDRGGFNREPKTLEGSVKFAHEEVERCRLRGIAPWLAIEGHGVPKCGKRCDREVIELVAFEELWTDVEPVDI